MQEIELLSINSLSEAQEEITRLDVNPTGVRIMSLKAVFKVVKISCVDPKTANIIKQEMLSRGGDVAVSKTVGRFETKPTDIIIMGTLAQYIRLIRKLRYQTFGDCSKIAKLLQETLFKEFDITKAEVW